MSSPNMNLPIPGVGVTSGPQWATDINSCLNVIDSHDHSSGYGVQITPAGININTDLPLNQNNLISGRSLRLSQQSAALALAADLDCLYDVLGDLYYNDGSGNQIQITQGGGIAGSPGSIANLASPASASYVSANQTFVWQSNTNTPANLDAGSVIFRNITASSKGVTVSAPVALASNYSMVWPLLPASQKFMTLDAGGNMSAPWAVDNLTLEINSNTLRVKSGGITASEIAADAVTTSKILDAAVTIQKRPTRATGTSVSAGGVGISNDINFSTSSASYVTATNSTTAIVTTGRPVSLSLIGRFSSADSNVSVSTSNTGAGSVVVSGSFQILRDSTVIALFPVSYFVSSSTLPTAAMSLPGGIIQTTDFPAAGSYTYSIQLKQTASGLATSATASVLGRLMASEWD